MESQPARVSWRVLHRGAARWRCAWLKGLVIGAMVVVNAPAAAQTAAETGESVEVDANAAAQPFAHFWERLFGLYRRGQWPCGWRGVYPRPGKFVAYQRP